MTITAYRLTQARYAATAFSGTGALHYDGRWHRAGTPVVYVAESPAVALLELLVHVERPRLLTMDFVVAACHFDETLVEPVEAYSDTGALPLDWRLFPWPRSTQWIGQRWLRTGRQPVLAVPSAVMPSARNYLLNPAHKRFSKLRLDPPAPFDLDPRLGN